MVERQPHTDFGVDKMRVPPVGIILIAVGQFVFIAGWYVVVLLWLDYRLAIVFAPIVVMGAFYSIGLLLGRKFAWATYEKRFVYYDYFHSEDVKKYFDIS